MSIDWPVAFIIVIALCAMTGMATEYIKSRARTAQDKDNLLTGEQYRSLVLDYQNLAKEIRETQSSLQVELAECHKKVDAIDKMMREVG